MTQEERVLKSRLSAFVAEARRFADQLDPLVARYESKSGEYLAGVCGAVLATVATYLVQLKYPFNLGLLQTNTLAAFMLLFGIAAAILIFRGPGRWKAENRKAKVKTMAEQMALDLAAMRTEILSLQEARAPQPVVAHAWADYESALHHHAVVRISVSKGKF